MDSEHFFKTACWFEAALILVALILAWIADIDPFASLYFSENAIAIGVLGTMPLFLLFLALQQLQHQSLSYIKDLLFKTLAANLYTRHWADLLWLSCIAGVSEELLFRGVIQPWIAASWGIMAGIVVSNIIFGLLHAITPLYTVLVTLVGIYLSWSMTVADENNLLIPIIIHSLYDFLALFALMRLYRANLTH